MAAASVKQAAGVLSESNKTQRLHLHGGLEKSAESIEVYSKREMATRRSSARRRYNSCIVRSASSWSVVSGGSESISRSMASMSLATASSFSISRVGAPCGMAKQSTICYSGKLTPPALPRLLRRLHSISFPCLHRGYQALLEPQLRCPCSSSTF
jgi:hypothetical protein